jgi:hypothetical protein
MVAVSPVKRHRTFIKLLPNRIHADCAAQYTAMLSSLAPSPNYISYVRNGSLNITYIEFYDEELLILRPTFEPEDHALAAVEYP